MARKQLRSLNFPDHFIRHRDFFGELTRLTSQQDIDDSLFDVVTGLADPNGASLRSVNVPNHFLRHQNFRLKLQKMDNPNDEVFRKDATFHRVRGLGDPDGVSFRSVNFPDRFIRHRDFDLFIEPNNVNSNTFAADATFFQKDPPQKIDD